MYSIIHEAVFDEEATKIFGTQERADSAIQGVEWYLAKDPQDDSICPLFMKISAKLELRTYKSEPTESFPAIVIYYTVSDDKKIVLRKIIRAEEEF